MTDKFTDSMEVAEVGDLRPSSIGGDCCRDCWNDTRVMQGVLIEGVTPDAARMLYKKCEIAPAGTMAELENLEASNKELLEALEAAQRFIHNGIQYGYINMPDKDCGDSALETPTKIEAAIQNARWQG